MANAYGSGMFEDKTRTTGSSFSVMARVAAQQGHFGSLIVQCRSSSIVSFIVQGRSANSMC